MLEGARLEGEKEQIKPQMRMHEKKVAYFISPHGFGHAARACSIMESLLGLNPHLRFEIFTKVPEWFFSDSLAGHDFGYHSELTDIGLVQKSPFEEDIPATLKALEGLYPLRKETVRRLSDEVRALGCSVVLCDISPLGISVARYAHLPSVLIENFTWDWIYEGYENDHAGMTGHKAYLADVFSQADYRIQTEPLCCPQRCDLRTGPISRRRKRDRDAIRREFGIVPEDKVIIVTMGGVREDYRFLSRLKELKDIVFIVPGGSEKEVFDDNLRLLPFRCGYFHPDMICASDGVIGKVGYSTVAEAYSSGVPFGYVTREKFRESEVIDAFIRRNMEGIAISQSEYQEGGFVSRIRELAALPRTGEKSVRPADEAARWIGGLL